MTCRAAGIAVAFALSVSIMTGGPAHAGWFWGSEAPKPADDQVVAHIQQAIDEERYVDAGALLDNALSGAESDPRLTLLVGRLNLARGRYDLALASFKGIETQPTVRAG